MIGRKKIKIVKKASEKQTIQNSKVQAYTIGDTVRIQIKALSPLHIGSGEIYEPTNFMIEDDCLYAFKDEALLTLLSSEALQQFVTIASSGSSDSFAKLNRYIKKHLKNEAKQAAYIKVPTTRGIAKAYEEKVGEIVQQEGDNTKVFNQFEIQKAQRKQNLKQDLEAYIPGSSLKGAISTAYQEYIYKKNGERELFRLFEDVKNMKNLRFKYFKVADSQVIDRKEKIGYACNRERFENDDTGPFTIVETIQPGSQFETTITYNKEKINFSHIAKACNDHYKPIFESMFEAGDVGEFFSDEFYNKYKQFQLNENQFLVRVGKYSGARAVTIDGLRSISIKESSKYTLKNQKEETTTWLFGDNSDSTKNLLPFGWILCEIVEYKL